MGISEEEISQWAVVHTFNAVSQHIFLCIEVQWSQYAVFTDQFVFCLVQQIHTFCVICCCLCLFDQSVVIVVSTAIVVQMVPKQTMQMQNRNKNLQNLLNNS